MVNVKDFDGDKCSANFVMTEESIDEIEQMLQKKSYYVAIDGTMNFGLGDDVVDLLLANMTS